MTKDELADKLEELNAVLQRANTEIQVVAEQVKVLVTKSKALVDMLDDAERNHGALIGTKTLKAANELRLELARWK